MDDQKRKTNSIFSDIKMNWDAVRSFVSGVKTRKEEKDILPGTPTFADKNMVFQLKKKKAKKKIKHNTNQNKVTGQAISSRLDPNAPNYESQLLKEQLKRKFGDYKHGLSDW